MEQQLPFVYKCVEIFERGAIEDEVKHGIQQLRYAAPARLCRVFDFGIDMFPTDRNLIFLMKILVTNAPLRLLKRGTNIDVIKSAETLSDISSPVDIGILFSDYGPDFEDHVRSIFESGADYRLKASQSLKKQLAKAGKKFELYSDPIQLVQDFARGGAWTCRDLGTQFFITTLAALPKLLMSVKSSCLEMYR